jgi:hypothetical protein
MPQPRSIASKIRPVGIWRIRTRLPRQVGAAASPGPAVAGLAPVRSFRFVAGSDDGYARVETRLDYEPRPRA